jgi:hypothetical protein
LLDRQTDSLIFLRCRQCRHVAASLGGAA